MRAPMEPVLVSAEATTAERLNEGGATDTDRGEPQV